MERDLKTQFSHKIVKLTSKIYLMNSKSEENNALIDEIVKSYTSEEEKSNKKFLKEINSLKEKNKELISNYKEKYEKFESSIKKTYDAKLKKIQNDYNILKEEKNKLKDGLTKEFNSKVKSMLSQIQKMKDEFRENKLRKFL